MPMTTDTITQEHSPLMRYAMAVGLTLLALGLTTGIAHLGIRHAFDLFQGAVFLTAMFEGLGPALLASLLSIVTIDFFLMPPLHTFTLEATHLYRLTVFAAVAVLTSSLSARLRRTQSELQHTRNELEHHVEERTEQLSQSNALLKEEVLQRRTAEKEILQISSREQRRLSEDLHDGLCQTLAGVRLLSQELKSKATAQQSPWTEDVERIEMRLGEALTQADFVSHGLYPVELETGGLMAALAELATKISMLSRARCEFKAPVPIFIQDSSTATHLYRIAQEATTNAIKRGKATRISIHLTRHGEQLTLSIVDNGVGLHGSPPRQGMGLKMMAYRARIINATFALRSRARGVTRLTCVLVTDMREESIDDGTQIRQAL